MLRHLPSCLLLLASAVSAQVNQIRAHNPVGVGRSDVVRVMLPWKQGDYRGQVLRVGEHDVQPQVEGAPWPDGSARFCSIAFPVSLQRGGSRLFDVQIAPAGSAPPPFRAASAQARGAAPRLGLRVGDQLLVFDRPEGVEDGAFVRRLRMRGRVPETTIWAQLDLELLSGLDHARLTLSYGDSDPRDPDIAHAYGPVELIVAGARFVPWYSAAKVLRAERKGAAQTFLLDRGGKWGDGQAQVVRGVLLLGPPAETDEKVHSQPVTAVATTWPASGAFGPWGFVPELPSPIGEPAAVGLAAEAAAVQPRGDPWSFGALGCNAVPGDTGAQTDFSSVVMTLEAHGWPARLFAIQQSVLQESCRPTHRRNVDVSPVQFSKHPGVFLWTSVPHSSSKDLLGKKKTIASWDTRKATQPRASDWWGHDRQHHSINYLTTYALMTADPWAMEECHHQVEICLGMYRVRSGQHVLDSAGAPRATGRSLQAMSMLYLVTGRADLRQRMLDRIHEVIDKRWVGGQVSGPIKTLGFSNGDPRSDLFRLFPEGDPRREQAMKWRFVMPWQDALGAIGLDAAARVLGDETADRIGQQVADMVVEHGIVREEGRWRAVKSLAWEDDGQLGQPVRRAFYDGYLLWMGPAVVIARRHAAAAGRSTERHDSILAQLRQRRTMGTWEWLGLK